MYILFSLNRRSLLDLVCCCGCFDSKEQLTEAVDYWMKEYPERTLTYEEWIKNDFSGAVSWDWCYIPFGSSVEDLESGGGEVPDLKFFGDNLLKIEWAQNE
jgi:hypothetical protein